MIIFMGTNADPDQTKCVERCGIICAGAGTKRDKPARKIGIACRSMFFNPDCSRMHSHLPMIDVSETFGLEPSYSSWFLLM